MKAICFGIFSFMIEVSPYPQRNLQLYAIRMGIVDSIAKWALLRWRTFLRARVEKMAQLDNLIVEKVAGIVLDSVGKGF